MASIIQLRRDIAANWASVNPILAQGELGVETDTLKIKCGNGTSTWSSLNYLIDTGSYLVGSAIGSTVQAYDADLTSWAGKTAPTGTVVGTSDTQTLTNKTLTDPIVTLGAGQGTAGQVPVSQGAGLPPVWGSVSTSPAGSTGQVQYNNSGAFGALSSGTSGQVLTSAGAGNAPTWASLSAGNMSVYTANGASVPAGNAFFMSSTSSIPSGWIFNGAGSGFEIPSGQSWVGLINSKMISGAFNAGGMTHSNGGTSTRWMFNSGSLSTASNIDDYLPMIMFRLL